MSTLTEIAARFKTSVKKLARDNKIANPNLSWRPSGSSARLHFRALARWTTSRASSYDALEIVLVQFSIAPGTTDAPHHLEAAPAPERRADVRRAR
jgi:hypothetical protein